METLLAFTGCWLALLAGLACVCWFAGEPKDAAEMSGERISGASTDRYRPMLRLLTGADLEFLRGHAGASPWLVKRVRAQHYSAFQEYLGSLRADYRRVWQTLLVLILQRQIDGAPLLAWMVRNRAEFAAATAAIRVRALFYRFGLGTVDASCLVEYFEQLQAGSRQVCPAARAVVGAAVAVSHK